MATDTRYDLPRWTIPFVCAAIFGMGFWGGKIVYDDPLPAQVAQSESEIELDDGPLFSREARLPYLRSDARRGEMALRERGPGETVSASRIEWVALAVKDLPELAPLAMQFAETLTVERLLPVYEKAYALADAEINKQETSPQAIAQAKLMLETNLDSGVN